MARKLALRVPVVKDIEAVSEVSNREAWGMDVLKFTDFESLLVPAWADTKSIVLSIKNLNGGVDLAAY